MRLGIVMRLGIGLWVLSGSLALGARAVTFTEPECRLLGSTVKRIAGQRNVGITKARVILQAEHVVLSQQQDPTYLEAVRQLAEDVYSERWKTPDQFAGQYYWKCITNSGLK